MPLSDEEVEVSSGDILGRFLAYADRLDSIMRGSVRPASYAETCTCGASVEVGTDVPPRERMRLAQHFIARHQHCANPTTPNPYEVGE